MIFGSSLDSSLMFSIFRSALKIDCTKINTSSDTSYLSFFQEILNFVCDEIGEILFVLDDIDAIYHNKNLTYRLLTSIRGLYEKGKIAGPLQYPNRINFLLSYKEEPITSAINPNQSPMNVGVHCHLRCLTINEILDLLSIYNLDNTINKKDTLKGQKQNFNEVNAQRILSRTEGHPYKVQMLLYRLANHIIQWEKLEEESHNIG